MSRLKVTSSSDLGLFHVVQIDGQIPVLIRWNGRHADINLELGFDYGRFSDSLQLSLHDQGCMWTAVLLGNQASKRESEECYRKSRDQ